MSWTKGKIEKAWRIFDKSMSVIADALDVPVDELKALILDGTLPVISDPEAGAYRDALAPPKRDTTIWLDETPPPPTPEVFDHLTKRATLADLAPPAPEVVLEQADPIIDKPISFEPSQPAGAKTQRRSNVAAESEPKRRPYKPAEFYLMHEGRYLHQSCEGLTDKREHAWRQPESKIAAVRRKFPETVDYLEVPAK